MNSQSYTQESLIEAQSVLGWDFLNDDIRVEIAGTAVSGIDVGEEYNNCLLYTSPSPRDKRQSRMPSSA